MSYGYITWIELAQEVIIWQASVIMVMNLLVSRLHAVSCRGEQLIVRFSVTSGRSE
jgi:hypothetical protein